MGDDVAPTSLNEGRGEMVAPALVVVFHLGLRIHVVGGWNRGGGTSRRGSGQPNVEMCQMRKGGRSHFWTGHERDFPWRAAVPKAGRAENKPC